MAAPREYPVIVAFLLTVATATGVSAYRLRQTSLARTSVTRESLAAIARVPARPLEPRECAALAVLLAGVAALGAREVRNRARRLRSALGPDHHGPSATPDARSASSARSATDARSASDAHPASDAALDPYTRTLPRELARLRTRTRIAAVAWSAAAIAAFVVCRGDGRYPMWFAAAYAALHVPPALVYLRRSDGAMWAPWCTWIGAVALLVMRSFVAALPAASMVGICLSCAFRDEARERARGELP